MWELDHKESWVSKNWCFELWCWRRLLRVPWTTRRSNQSILKEINSEYSLEGMILKLKLQYSGYLMGRADSLIRWLDGITNSMDMFVSKFWEMLKDRETWLAAIHGVGKSLTQLSDWRTRHTFYRNTQFIYNALLNIYTSLNHIYFYFSITLTLWY